MKKKLWHFTCEHDDWKNTWKTWNFIILKKKNLRENEKNLIIIQHTHKNNQPFNECIFTSIRLKIQDFTIFDDRIKWKNDAIDKNSLIR